jgi:voltage-gated potassium channel
LSCVFEMYGSTMEQPLLGSSDPSARPLLNPPISTKEQRDRRREYRESKKKLASKRYQSNGGGAETNVFSQVFKQSTRSEDERSHHDYHSFLYTLLNPRSHQAQAILFKKFITLIILSDMTLFIISTEPHFHAHALFYWTEGIASCIFFVEYFCRLAVCTESRRYKKLGPVLGRLRYAVTPSAIIDAFATFPFFIELFTGIPLPTLTYLRFFRLLRLTKTDQFAKAMDACTRVLYYNRQILYVAALLCIFLVLFTAVLLYYLRPNKHDPMFKSIPATMYMSTLLLTGQGGPDASTFPWYTKSIILATGVFSVAMFAIPASMLTWGFEAEAERLAAKHRRRAQKRMQARLTGKQLPPLSSDDSEWTSSSVDTSDEEYQKIIAGEDEGAEDQSEAAILKELLEVFQKADSDGSDSLSRDEFLSIITGKLREVSQKGGLASPSSFGLDGPTTVTDKPRVASDASLSERMDILERKVDSMDATLGRIVQLLENKRY